MFKVNKEFYNEYIYLMRNNFFLIMARLGSTGETEIKVNVSQNIK